MPNTANKPKSYKATIAFWFVYNPETKTGFVLPSIICNLKITNPNNLKLGNIWNNKILDDIGLSKGYVYTIIPTILTVSGLNKDISKYESIREIEIIQQKIEELTNKYCVKTSSQ